MGPHVWGVDEMEKALLRQVRAVRGRVPADHVRLRLSTTPVGWVTPAVRDAMLAEGARQKLGAVVVGDPADLAPIATRLAARGIGRVRGEAFDVLGECDPGGPWAMAGRRLTTVDRGALPVFGIVAHGVHINGLVERPDGLHVWVGRRSADRLLDPGKLDHLAAGGVAAGDTVASTLAKEAAEEAAIPGDLARNAVPVSTISYTCTRPEGLRRDVLHCFDLTLPEDFVPRPADGEQSGFELWPAARVLETIVAGDAFKFNVAMVLIDLFLRRKLLGLPALQAVLDAAPPAGTGRNRRPS